MGGQAGFVEYVVFVTTVAWQQGSVTSNKPVNNTVFDVCLGFPSDSKIIWWTIFPAERITKSLDLSTHNRVPGTIVNRLNTRNRLTFLNKHLIIRRSFGGSCVKMFDCRAFSLLETVPGCQAFSHRVIILVCILTEG